MSSSTNFRSKFKFFHKIKKSRYFSWVLRSRNVSEKDTEKQLFTTSDNITNKNTKVLDLRKVKKDKAKKLDTSIIDNSRTYENTSTTRYYMDKDVSFPNTFHDIP